MMFQSADTSGSLPGSAWPVILGCLAFGSCIAGNIAHSILDICFCVWGSEQSRSQGLSKKAPIGSSLPQSILID